jgi:type III restriction enzyme
MEQTSPPVKLTRGTLLEVLRGTANKSAAVANPHEFATEVVRIIKDSLADQLVNGIQYEKLSEWYELTQFEAEFESWESYLVPTTHSIYDYVELDSQIEREFVEGLEKRSDVKLYVKLPSWFTVQTPVGEYNPDWAIVVEDRDAHGEPTGKPLLYLVRETKGPKWQTELRPSERRKIVCGGHHFTETLGVDYKVVSSANEI